MKTIYKVLTIILFTISINSYTQSFVKNLDEFLKITLNDIYGDMKITGTETDKIEIILTGFKSLPEDVNLTAPKRFKNDNTGIGLNYENINGKISISPSNPKAQFTHYKILIPETIMLEIRNENLNENITITDKKNMDIFNKIEVRNLKNEINISLFASEIVLNEITGPVVSGLFAGSYVIDFSKLNQENPSNIEIFAGNIEVVLSENTQCNLLLSSKVGSLYSDFEINNKTVLSPAVKISYDIDFEVFSKSIKLTNENPELTTGEPIKGSKIEGKINNGGVQLNLSTFAGNISIKKK